jgi:hypothetical protein
LWDSQTNNWIYNNPSGSGNYDSAMVMMGPQNSSGLGNEVGITTNAIPKGAGGHHMTSSAIFDVSGSVGIGTSSPTSIAGYTSLTIDNSANGPLIDLNNSGTNNMRLLSLSSIDQRIYGAGTLRFYTSGSERMRITSDGQTRFTFVSDRGIRMSGTLSTESNLASYQSFTENIRELRIVGSTLYFNTGDGSNSTGTERMSITEAGVVQMGSTAKRNALQQSGFGYNGNYKTLIIGSAGTNYLTDATTLCFGVDVSGNTNGSFTGAGAEYMFRNVGYFKSPNSANNNYNTLMNWDSNGVVNIPNQPSFTAWSSGTDITLTSGQVLVFDGTMFNIGSCYSTSTGKFTAPVAGRYLFTWNVYCYTSGVSMTLTINGNQQINADVVPLIYSDGASSQTQSNTIIFNLAAGDYVEVRARAGYTPRIYRGHSHFSGCLLS